MKRKIITWTNVKGRTGKACGRTNVSSSLARRGRKVVIWENDPQGSAQDYFNAHAESTTWDLYENNVDHVTEAMHPINQNLWLIPSRIELASWELEWPEKLTRKLGRRIDELPSDIDFVMIDSPGNIGSLLLSSLLVSTHLIVATTPEHMSWRGINILLHVVWKEVKKAGNNHIQNLGLFVSRYKGDRFYNPREMMSKLRADFGKYPGVFRAVIPDSVVVAEAAYHGVDVYSWDKHSKAAIKYEELTDEILRRMKR